MPLEALPFGGLAELGGLMDAASSLAEPEPETTPGHIAGSFAPGTDDFYNLYNHDQPSAAPDPGATVFARDAGPRSGALDHDAVELIGVPGPEVADAPAPPIAAAAPALDDDWSPWIVEQEAVVQQAVVPAAPAGTSVSVPPPQAAPLTPELAALLDEAELYLAPSWADYGEAGRLVAQVAAIVPADPRVLDLQSRLRGPETGAEDFTELLAKAQALLERQEYWPAVDLFEEVLAKQPEHVIAHEGAARGRLLARWFTQLAGAGSDPGRLVALGDSYAFDAPDLASAAYAASFASSPAVETLGRWLSALANCGEPAALHRSRPIGNAGAPPGGYDRPAPRTGCGSRSIGECRRRR